MELLSRVLGAGDEDPDLSALSAALKGKLGLSELKKPPSTMSSGVELLTRGVESCRGIRSTPLDTCPSPFHPRVRTVPVCTNGDSTEAEMEGYGLAALVPLATVYPSPPSGPCRPKFQPPQSEGAGRGLVPLGDQETGEQAFCCPPPTEMGPKAGPAQPPPPQHALAPPHPHCRPSHGDQGPSPHGQEADAERWVCWDLGPAW